MPVIKSVSYCLIHTPDLLYYVGSTPAAERAKHPSSEFLAKLPSRLRSYQQALAYLPNQTYIGNLNPAELAAVPRPWFSLAHSAAERYGPYGELMPESEFYGLMKICDAFDLVILEPGFLAECKQALAVSPIIPRQLTERLSGAKPLSEIERLVEAHTAVGLYSQHQLVGCVRQAHESDENLSAHVVLENLAAKASAVLAVLHLLAKSDIAPSAIDYILECSEEACGDVNQRGGGNLAKAIGEIAGLSNATGSDIRAFCAGPVHALLQAGSLIQAGIFKNVVVVGGGAVAKLGMNAKDHVAKHMPALEDVLGSFAVLIGENDLINPRLRLDVIGKHTIASGAAPQQVIKALVSDPLARLSKKITDIDFYAVEMQNPELTEPAGAGNVPEANYKMIGALAAIAGEIARTDLPRFVAEHGFPGFAPTQGHIPSGIPLLGHFRKQLLAGQMKSGMIIGKGSLFLGRMTNLFDGLSLILEANPGAEASLAADTCQILVSPLPAPAVGRRLRIGLTLPGSEHGCEEIRRGADLARRQFPDIEVVLIDGSSVSEAHKRMEQLLASKQLDGAVTLHYPFPIGVTTVGLVVTPARGRKMFVASSTGASAADRVEALVRNAIYGSAVAKAYGVARPSVGLLNIDGARQAEEELRTLAKAGYPVKLVESSRKGGLMRGNDLLLGTPDIMVADTLTGNLLVKMLSAYTSGGDYETVGYGYGPAAGENYDKIISVISRASGAPVIANAIEYTAGMIRSSLPALVQSEIHLAQAAGFDGLFPAKPIQLPSLPQAPQKKPVTKEITGLDVLELENAKARLWLSGIYAEAGMGCTGPVLLVAEEDYEYALQLLERRDR